MKGLDRWLLPILTCLVVLVAILLPQRLSRWRDEAVLGGPHTEELKTENELPTQALALEERIALLGRYNGAPEAMTVLTQELDRGSGAETLMWAELERLCESGVLEWELLPERFPSLQSWRLYLRAPEAICGAGFLVMDGYSEEDGVYLSLALDEETGYALELELSSPAARKFAGEPVNIGIVFLDRLGVENECAGYGKYSASFDLPGADCRYDVSLEDRSMLRIIPFPRDGGFATDSNGAAAAK